MAALQSVRGISAINVTEIPDGEGCFRVRVEWTDASGARREALHCGYSATCNYNDLDAATRHSEDARAGYLIGLIRGLSIGGRD